MNQDIPPVAKSERSGFIDESVLNFSTKLFECKILGYIIAIIFNIFYIYYWYHHANLLSIITFAVLYFLIVRIIQIKILKQ